MRWPERPFGDLYVTPSRNGVYKAAGAKGAGTKIVNMGELFGHDFIGSQEMSRLEMSEDEMELAGLREGDLLFGRRSLVESGAGKCSIVREMAEPMTFESSIIRVRVDPTISDPLFYFYWFRSHQGRRRIQSIVSGTNVKGIRGSDLRTLPVTCPDKGSQERIVARLLPYDELIENNRRRMALLEEAARQLYREWFVRLRFPGHEHTPLTNGLPEGWERKPLGECVEFRSGGTPSKARSEFWEGDIPWVSSGEMTETRLYDTPLHISEEGAEAGSRIAAAGTILAVVRGMSLAKEFRISVVTRDMAFNQDLKALECKPGVDSEYLFATLLADRARIRELCTEASHGTKKLETPVLEAVPILVPTSLVQRHFREIIDPMNAQRDNLSRQNEKLRAARDLLLPRLMSGEIAV